MILLAIAATVYALVRGPKPPPSIFETPADDVAGYLTTRDFSALPLEERVEFVSGVAARFRSMEQADSAIVAAFFAGLGAPAREVLRDNIRILGKDILLNGAESYLALATDAERARFLDEWLLKWGRLGRDLLGSRPRSDEEIMDRARRDAKRDAERTQDLNPQMAQEIIDFWNSDVASVSTPKEQGQIFKFIPALRDHLISGR